MNLPGQQKHRRQAMATLEDACMKVLGLVQQIGLQKTKRAVRSAGMEDPGRLPWTLFPLGPLLAICLGQLESHMKALVFKCIIVGPLITKFKVKRAGTF
jgi:hypothetical protein